MIYLIEQIDNDFLSKYRCFNKKLINKTYFGINFYLKSILKYSIVNKDIKTFLLFIYLHDTDLVVRKKIFKKGYNKWLYRMSYLYTYEIQKFTQNDLNHYMPITNKKDKKIYDFLLDNMKVDKHKKLFVKKHSWIKLKNIFIIYCKVIGKLILYYKEILEIRYAPKGIGYYECLERWNSNFFFE